MKRGSAGAWAAGGIGCAVLAVVAGGPVVVAALFSVLLGDERESSTCRAVVAGDSPGVPHGWGDEVEDAARVAGVPAEVIAAQLEAESGWDPGAVSPVGAAGLAQFMPGTWEQYGQGDPLDPEASIRAQGRYMRDLMGLAEPHAGDSGEQVRLALAAYNWGPGNMAAAGWDYSRAPAETTAYVPAILSGAQVGFAPACSPVTGQYAGDLGDGEWAPPLPGGRLTAGGAFGGRNVPGLPAWAQNHVGIDLATEDGAGQIVAPFPMRVTAIYEPDGCVLARQLSEPGFGIALCHMDSWDARVGMEYARGDVVGEEGSRAASVGVGVIEHAHIELYQPGAGDPTTPGPSAEGIIDPTPIFRAKGAL